MKRLYVEMPYDVGFPHKLVFRDLLDFSPPKKLGPVGRKDAVISRETAEQLAQMGVPWMSDERRTGTSMQPTADQVREVLAHVGLRVSEKAKTLLRLFLETSP